MTRDDNQPAWHSAKVFSLFRTFVLVRNLRLTRSVATNLDLVLSDTHNVMHFQPGSIDIVFFTVWTARSHSHPFVGVALLLILAEFL